MHMQICENYYGQNISLFWIIHDSGLFERSVYLLDTDQMSNKHLLIDNRAATSVCYYLHIECLNCLLSGLY